MRVFTEFLKSTILGGLFVLLPILLFYLLLGETLGIVVGLATPVADLFPKGTFDKASFPVLIAMVLIIGVSFSIGVAMRWSTGKRFWSWVESNTIERMPMYNVLKSIFTGFLGKENNGAFKPALLKSSDGEQLAYVIEDHANGKVTVLLPWAPTPFAGSIMIVDRERVELLDMSLSDFTVIVSHWGVGTRKLMAKKRL